MANWKAGMRTDAAGAVRAEYQVLLNFRGEDTRHNFTDFLYDRLVDAGVHTFRDEEEVPQGDVISDRLERAINNSTLYIPIFSLNYAASKWCLRELKLMVDNVSNSENKKSILPIFLLVEPDDVKLKTRPNRDPLYKAAFEEHEKNYPKEVEAWKTALGIVDERKGWVVEKNTSQATIVKLVVQRVLEKLKIKEKLVTEHLVGLDDRVKDLMKLIDVNHPDLQLIVIYGMGGIGKSTIAKEVFNQLCSRFGKRCSFLEDVRRSSSTKEGIVQLQKQLLSDIVDFVSDVKDSDHGMQRIRETLPVEKVLVVLDDVHNKEHIKMLIGDSALHPGSRIIVTTREKTVRQVEWFEGETREYDMPKMDAGHALHLFCWHAFGTNHPRNDFGLSSEIVQRMGGLPLAIKVTGSLLKGKNEEFWKETLLKLGILIEDEILKVLIISYDDLNKQRQQIFLDISCFLVNEKKTDAIYLWDDGRVFPISAIEALVEKCLLKILDNDKFWMHDQLIYMGRHIVYQKSLGDLRKQSRLWIAEEALHIIRTKERKDKVQSLSDNIPEITNEDLERLPNLRFFKLTGGICARDSVLHHSKLKWFSWSSPPKKDFEVYNLYLDELVVCKLYGIDFKDNSKAWGMIKTLQHLKVLSFAWCSGITTIPDISKCLSLKRLTVERCSNLKRIGSFIGNLTSLMELKIEGCRNLTYLPKEIGALVELQHFSLSRCSNLRELPGSIGKLTSLMELDLSDTLIKELPDSIGKLESLHILRFPLQYGREDHDWQLPSGISTLVKLEELDLSGHNKLTGKIPGGIGELSSLRMLNLERTRICEIPETFSMLHSLQTLNLSGCHEIHGLPKLPTSLTCLHLESEKLLSVPNLSILTSLDELLLSNYKLGGEKSKSLKGCDLTWIGKLCRLKKLNLNLLNILAPAELSSLSHLKELVLRRVDLKLLVQLPSSNSSWRNLSALEIECCEVKNIPLERLPQLEKLTVKGCPRLQILCIPLKLRKLRQVNVSSCSQLVEIRVLGLLESLEYLCVDMCKSLTRINGLTYLPKLETLRIVLANAEGLDQLESLKSLEDWRWRLLRRSIDESCTGIPDDRILHIEWSEDSIRYHIKVSFISASNPHRLMILRNTLNKSCQLKSISAKPDKGQRDDDRASRTNTTTQNSANRVPAQMQPTVEVVALPNEAVGPSRKEKKNDSRQVNPIRSARLMKGPTGGTSNRVHLDG